MKLLTIFLTFLIFILASTSVSAHGGFEKRAGNVIVYVKQNPISPLVGERVTLSFSFRDESIPNTGNISDQNLVNWPVTLSVVDTYYGDESKDKIVHRKAFKTDSNGSFEFEYIFSKENYFDIDLDFKDSKGNNLETGFLIQPRIMQGFVESKSINHILLFTFFFGVIFGLILSYFMFFRKGLLNIITPKEKIKSQDSKQNQRYH